MGFLASARREQSAMGTESLAWFLIVIAVFGLIVGAIGRLLVPGGSRLGLVETMGAGIAGALIGGFVGRLLLGPGLTQGWIWVLSILGAALVVALVSRRGGAGSWAPRRRLMSERVYDEPVRTYDEPVRTYDEPVRTYDDGHRPYRSSHRSWMPRRLMGRGDGGRRLGGLGGVGRSYGAPPRRRGRFF